jgi:predicted secreted protein
MGLPPLQLLRALFFSVVKCVTGSVAGYNGVLSISPDGGTTYHVFGEVTDVSLKFTLKTLDATSHSSAGHEEFIPGNDGWTGTAKGLSVVADAGQTDIAAALAGKTKLKFRFDPYGTAVGKPRREGFGFITDFQEDQPNTNLVAINVSIQGTGALTFSTQ